MGHGYVYVGVSVGIVVIGIFAIDHFESFQLGSKQPEQGTYTNPMNVHEVIRNLHCGVDLGNNVFVFYGTGSCSYAEPTILSQAKWLSAGDLKQLLDYDEKLYSYIVTPHQCPECGTPPIPQSCEYDSNGEFVPHLSDAQKAVILDMNKSYSVPICPFTVKPNISNYTPTSSRGTTNITNTEQKIWFEFVPTLCQTTPWGKVFASLSIQLSETSEIKSYFNDQGITIIESKWTNNPSSQIHPPKCEFVMWSARILFVLFSSS